MKRRFLALPNKSFSFRILFTFLLFVFVISFAFTVVFIHQQHQALKDTLLENGKTLSRMLSYSAKLGVFTEDDSRLKDPVAGVFKQEGVREVSVFNEEREPLMIRHRVDEQVLSEAPDVGTKRKDHPAFGKLKEPGSTLVLEGPNSLEFWSTVVSGPPYGTEDSLYFNEDAASEQGKLIGFTRIVIDKGILDKPLEDMAQKGYLIGGIFMILGFLTTYFAVKRTTRPLIRLTEGVKTLGEGRYVEKIPVETQDEVGRLAAAFNRMLDSLRQREADLKESEGTLRLLSSRLLKAQEQERQRLSKELHDGLGHDLALLKMRVRSVEKKVVAKDPGLKEECEETILYIEQVIENIRRLSRDLSPSVLEDLGLSTALQWQADHFAERDGMEVVFDIDDIDADLPLEAHIHLYRILQEILTNVSKHAHANRVAITVKKEEDSVLFRVLDNGRGFEINPVPLGAGNGGGMGLTTIRERANMLKGTLEIQSRPGKGTQITLIIPIQEGG